MKTIAIMQPYFFPYIGYFQLIAAVDTFVIYDNIQFTKKGWIHRNRILVNGHDSYITLPIKKDACVLDVKNRCLSQSFESEKDKLLRRIQAAYRTAPFWGSVYPLIERCVGYANSNLFEYVYYSIQETLGVLNIEKPLLISSKIKVDHGLKAEDKVLEICGNLCAERYINPIGGVDLYSPERFRQYGIELKFLRSKAFSYQQYDNPFVPNLSIIDVLMFNSVEKIRAMLKEYELFDKERNDGSQEIRIES